MEGSEGIYNKDGDLSAMALHKLDGSIINHPNEVAISHSNSGYLTPNKSNETPNIAIRGKLNRRIGLVKSQGFLFNADQSQEKDKKDTLNITPPIPIKETPFKSKVYSLLKVYYQNAIHNYINIFFTMLALFSVDCKLIFVPATEEDSFTVYYLIVVFYFIIEMILTAICVESYIISFYSFVDLLCIVFMMLELEFFIKLFCQTFRIFFGGHYADYPDYSQIEKYVRLIRVFRMMNVIKLYHSTMAIIARVSYRKNIKKMEEVRKKKLEKKKKLLEERMSRRKVSFNSSLKMNKGSGSFNADPKPQFSTFHLSELTKKLDDESRIRQKNSLKNLKLMYKEKKINTVITAKTNQKILLIILIIYFINPLTDDTLIMCPYDVTFNFFTRFINKVHETSNFFNESQGKPMSYFFANMTLGQYSIINATYENLTLYVNETMRNDVFRFEELGYAVFPPGKGVIVFSMKKKSEIRAIVAICRALFTYLLLLFFSMSLSKDAKMLLLNPLEDMIGLVDVVAKDPVNSKLIEDLKKSCQNSIENMKKKNSSDFEIKIIQFAVIRISALLAIGFGEAGGEILKENIQSSEGLNPMLQGKKIEAIFGFCYIRHFAEINEVLQEKTMIFVNKISEIVHSSVDKFDGITNKNLGDCFLLVWKIKDAKQTGIGLTPTTIIEEERSCIQSDQALLSFLSIIKKINKSEPILAYRKNKALQERLGKGFKIQMGFGLHRGWGIEGAIGSFYKIDCSYLSPNVNIAARLETATNIYGVDILFSGEFYDTLSTFMKRMCRQIDVVALKGCVTPVKLYIVDVNANLHPGKAKNGNKKFNIREKRVKKLKLRSQYESEMTKTIGEVYLNRSKGLKYLLHKTKTETFLSYFEDGFNNYIDGDWEEAYINLKNALYLDKSDGPSKTLLAFIKKNNKLPPNDWDGFRKLEAKF